MDVKINIWIVDDDRSIRWVIETALKKAGHVVTSFASADGVVEMMAKEVPDVLLTDIRMPGQDGIELLRELQAAHPNLPVIVMTAHSDMDSAVSAYDSGAFEYLPKPFDIDEMLSQVERAYIQNRPLLGKYDAIEIGTSTSGIIGVAPAMQAVFRAIGKLSRSNVTVMINGESGTGKELVAKALHQHSPRADKPFIALNMAAIPKDLLESELFGHEKGAFTGATSRRKGRFEQADGGTLFLDEIGDMPADMQTRLLRVLSDGEFYTVGGYHPTKVKVRIVTATHQGLEDLVQQGLFREDLFHRLNVVRIKIPPVRERREDIPLLLNYFLTTVAKELSVEAKQLHPDATQRLRALSWPGNVREIENVCRWLTVMCPSTEIHVKDLPTELLEGKEEPIIVGGDWLEMVKKDISEMLQHGDEGIAKRMVSAIEKILIYEALEHTKGRRQDAARCLGWGRNTLTRKIKELGA
ncbi:MAG: nitrogen regulation protein NR(I) [Piscirickettsiaceae bacterium]|nr:MAG: nitrogen regulation protein NR(I) [Piscirickettsiaceae bacterium]PCI66636.1 MAG: nitrogen regulation protein NR(I) [Piscirickettsiaceae bacterium]